MCFAIKPPVWHFLQMTSAYTTSSGRVRLSTVTMPLVFFIFYFFLLPAVRSGGGSCGGGGTVVIGGW